MNISENILKNSLKNVYFLIGAPCGGKTTMCKAISDKYDFTFFNGNHRDQNFEKWQEICNADYQKVSAKRITDWEYFFNRPTEEYIEWLTNVGTEYFEYAIIEIIKLAQNNIVITDINIPSELIKQISTYNRIACLITTPDIVVRDYYQRDDHRDIYECIMSLKNPQQSFDNNKTVLRTVCNAICDDIYHSGLFYILRDGNSTIETTLALLEKHFSLS